MIWSHSAAKMFRQCQLQWFLKTKVANANANDRYLRDEATDYDADALDFAELSDNDEEVA